jgi:hypothetical protein
MNSPELMRIVRSELANRFSRTVLYRLRLPFQFHFVLITPLFLQDGSNLTSRAKAKMKWSSYPQSC